MVSIKLVILSCFALLLLAHSSGCQEEFIELVTEEESSSFGSFLWWLISSIFTLIFMVISGVIFIVLGFAFGFVLQSDDNPFVNNLLEKIIKKKNEEPHQRDLNDIFGDVERVDKNIGKPADRKQNEEKHRQSEPKSSDQSQKRVDEIKEDPNKENKKQNTEIKAKNEEDPNSSKLINETTITEEKQEEFQIPSRKQKAYSTKAIGRNFQFSNFENETFEATPQKSNNEKTSELSESDNQMNEDLQNALTTLTKAIESTGAAEELKNELSLGENASTAMDTEAFDLTGLDNYISKGENEASTDNDYQEDLLSALNQLSSALNESNNNNTNNNNNDNNNESSMSFDISELDKLTAALNTNNAEITHLQNDSITQSNEEKKQPLSYDDFFKGLKSGNKEETLEEATMNQEHYKQNEKQRGDQLIRSFAVREDMNKRGMKRIGRKSVTYDASGKSVGVYQMEDTSYANYPTTINGTEFGVFCVFDGHVGKEAAEFASQNVYEVVRVEVETQGVSENMKSVLEAVFEKLDKQMTQFELVGTTATVVLVWRYNGHRYMQSANVGDSSSYFSRDNKAIMLSKDHKVNDKEEHDRLLAAGSEIYPGQSRLNGLAVSRALGDMAIKQSFPGVTYQPYVSEAYLLQSEDDILIIASDGLWDIISGQSVINTIRGSNNAEEIVDALITKATSSPKCNDNVTVIVVLL